MSTTITSHLNAIQTLTQTTPTIAAPVETLIKAVKAQANDMAEDLDRARRWADEAQTDSRASLKARFEAEGERAQALRDLATAKTEQVQTTTVTLLRELMHSPAKLLLVLREAGYSVGVRDFATGVPCSPEDEIMILSDPGQHGPSMIAILNKI